MLAETPLWVDVYDAVWNRLGDGPVPLISASVTRAFDGAGSFSFDAPATDERVIALLKDQRRIKIYYNDPQTNQVRLLGSGIISKRGRKYSASGSQKSFSGTDALDELVNFIALPNTIFANQSVSNVASSLAVLAGWQAETEAGITNLISARYDGSSVLKSLRAMTEKVGLHIREKVDVPSDHDHVIEVGRFGTDIGLYIQNGDVFTSRIFDTTEIAFIDSLTVVHESASIVNWVIPMGSGEGESALTLEKATRSATYARETTVNNGKTLYFKRNQASINKYGIKQKLLTVKDVAPVGNSDTSIGYAADVLDEATDNFLERSGEPQIVYKLSIKKGSKLVRPGDLIHMSFRGLVRDRDGQEIEDETVEGDFYVLKVTENVSGSGITINLEISNVDKLPDSIESYILSAVEDLQVRDTKPALTNFRDRSESEKPVQQWDGQPNYIRYATFPLKLDDTITAVTHVSLHFTSKPMNSSSVGAYSATGPSVLNSFNVVIGDNYPQDISLYIDNVNVTSIFGPSGGTWNPSPSNSPVDVTIDITDYIVGAAGGLHQIHTIEFRVAQQTRDVRVPGYGGASPLNALYGNMGIISAEIVTHGTSQPIKSSG